MSPRPARGLKEKLLLAAVRLTGARIERVFSAEELLIEAWTIDKNTWGLKGYEKLYPDNKKLSTELDRGSAHGMGPIGEGLIERVGEKLYRLTLEGLDYALTLEESGDVERQSMERTLAEAVGRILDKPEYLAWKSTGIAPKSFRRAGGFWNVAPGLPPGVIRDRILEIERVLVRAYLYEERREEVMGALRFCALLRAKFFRDLKLLQVTLPDLDLPEA